MDNLINTIHSGYILKKTWYNTMLNVHVTDDEYRILSALEISELLRRRNISFLVQYFKDVNSEWRRLVPKIIFSYQGQSIHTNILAKKYISNKIGPIQPKNVTGIRWIYLELLKRDNENRGDV